MRQISDKAWQHKWAKLGDWGRRARDKRLMVCLEVEGGSDPGYSKDRNQLLVDAVYTLKTLRRLTGEFVSKNARDGTFDEDQFLFRSKVTGTLSAISLPNQSFIMLY
jgi:hypothetical protein